MQSEQTNISDLMHGNCKLIQGICDFVIPCYQRPYSWTEEQCADLLADLERLIERQRLNPEPSHFIGTMVLQVDDSKLLVIDGQQRLITMKLFYLALEQVAKEHLSEPNSNFNQNLQCKLTLHGLDKEAMDSLAKDDNSHSEAHISKNYQCFVQKLRESHNLEQLSQITKYLNLIVITLDQSDEPQFVFESLNARGLPLSVWDKVRNLALMRVSNNDLELYFNDYWLKIESLIPEDERDNFIYYYLSAKNFAESSSEERYHYFKRYAQNFSGSKKDLLLEMRDYAEIYAQIIKCCYDSSSFDDSSVNVELQNNIGQYLSYLMYSYKVAGDKGFWEWIPFVMRCMMAHKNHELSAVELLEVLKRLDSFILRYWTAGYSKDDDDLQSFFIELYQQIKDQGQGEIFCDNLDYLLYGNGRAKYLKNDYIKYVFETQNFYGARKTTTYGVMLNYILQRFETEEEYECHPESVDRKKVFDHLTTKLEGYSVEHIMPQTLSSEWRKELGDNAEKIHSNWLHRLGNLTLVTKPANSSLSNQSFSNKCDDQEYGYSKSDLRITSDIPGIAQESPNACWDEEALKARTEKFYQMALKIWPSLEQTNPDLAQLVITMKDDSLEMNSMEHDYCLERGVVDLKGTQPTYYIFKGQHYDVESWVDMQRKLVKKIYDDDPERLRSWFNSNDARCDWLRKFFSNQRDFATLDHTPQALVELDNSKDHGFYFDAKQIVPYKLKVFLQLFEVMGIDPQQLTIHLSSAKKL